MKKRKAKNSEGRPREYSDRMRTISLSLPESLIELLDSHATETGISRQRLIIEWLSISSLLHWRGFIVTKEDGTAFNQFPKIAIKESDREWRVMTNKDMMEHFAKMASSDPEALACGWNFQVLRDVELSSSPGPEVNTKVSKQPGKRRSRKAQ